MTGTQSTSTAGPDRRQRWPSRLWLVRHGESAGNIASELARQSGVTHIDIASRDADVELSERGIEQSRALGHWFAAHPPGERPEIVLSSRTSAQNIQLPSFAPAKALRRAPRGP